MQEMTMQEVDAVSGAVSEETVYATSVGVATAMIGIALTVTAPAWGTALLLGSSIAASGIAIAAAWD